jgi:Arc/MetJ-type ribon-helix-helix transcriptional regulator
MARPRIDEIDERIIESFVTRGIYTSQREVLHNALRALVKEQMTKEGPRTQLYSDDTYAIQFDSPAGESEDASMGNLVRQSATRQKDTSPASTQ